MREKQRISDTNYNNDSPPFYPYTRFLIIINLGLAFKPEIFLDS